MVLQCASEHKENENPVHDQKVPWSGINLQKVDRFLTVNVYKWVIMKTRGPAVYLDGTETILTALFRRRLKSVQARSTGNSFSSSWLRVSYSIDNTKLWPHIKLNG